MHEFSVALSIVEIAEEEARRAGDVRIVKIDLEIGTLSGIELDSLNFVWEPAVNGTVLEKAEKCIHVIEAQAVCIDCQHVFKVEQLFSACPSCGSLASTLNKGKELRIKSLTIEKNKEEAFPDQVVKESIS